MKKIYFLAFVFVLLGCSKDLDDLLGYESPQEEVKDFVWKAMNRFYLWQSEIPDLADNRFAQSVAYTTILNPQYKAFLGKFNSPKDLFEHLKYSQDRFSIITDNYVALEQSFQGISVTTGMDFSLSLLNNNDVIGVVNYVMPDSPAYKQGIRRGDIFTQVNDQNLTRNNFRRLLFSNALSIKVSFVQYDVASQSFVSLVQKEIQQIELKENPIFLHKVIHQNGKKIGYLLYNQFVAGASDLELNRVFGKFQQENISDLVLDLRYNSGGSVQTAVYLASMIKSGTSQVFVKQNANAKLKQWSYQQTFTNNIRGTALNSLNLSKLYVITSQRTASASELIINGLSPYMQVILIGDTTTGKNTASVTIKDIIDDKGTINPKHTWALQPIVLISQNANGFGDYQNGFAPDYPLKEKILEMGELGTETDPLLRKSLDIILGRSSTLPMKKEQNTEFPIFDWFKNHTPSANKMYINKL